MKKIVVILGTGKYLAYGPNLIINKSDQTVWDLNHALNHPLANDAYRHKIQSADNIKSHLKKMKNTIHKTIYRIDNQLFDIQCDGTVKRYMMTNNDLYVSYYGLYETSQRQNQQDIYSVYDSQFSLIEQIVIDSINITPQISRLIEDYFINRYHNYNLYQDKLGAYTCHIKKQDYVLLIIARYQLGKQLIYQLTLRYDLTRDVLIDRELFLINDIDQNIKQLL